MKLVIFFSSNVMNVKKKYNGCCSDDCSNIYSLPYEKQKELRKGKKNSNKIFKKGRFDKSIINKI